jgi:Protein of unknown function (DUF2523)
MWTRNGKCFVCVASSGKRGDDMSFLISFLSQLATWLQAMFIALPLYLLGLLLAGLNTLLQDIPVPSFFSGAAGYISSIPAFPAFLLQGLLIPQGLAIVISAYVIRFLIRRLPFIG